MTNSGETSSINLWQELEDKINEFGCGETCDCAKSMIKTARRLRDEGRLASYLGGEMTVNDALRMIAIADRGLVAIGTFGKVATVVVVSRGAINLLGSAGYDHGEVTRDGSIGGDGVPRDGQPQDD